MKKEIENYKTRLPMIIGMILIGVLLYFNISTINKYITILKPFWVGIILAYILNIPITFIEMKFKKLLPNKFNKYSRLLSIGMTIIFSILALYLIVMLVVPQLVTTISQVIENSNSYVDAIENLINGILQKFNFGTAFDLKKEMAIIIESIAKEIESVLKANIPSIINNTIGITTSLLVNLGTFFIGFIISIYLLSSKEILLNQIKRTMQALLPRRISNTIIEISKDANKIFKQFISGQVSDCIALGVMCYVGMLLFRFPFALLISVLVTVLAIIPYFGGFFAMMIGAILMLPNSPAQSVYFIIYFMLLQQVEGNFVYPRIVGDKVGLPSVWVLVSVILFSGIFGFMGLFFAVPLTAVIYHLFKKFIDNKLKTPSN